MGMGWEWEYDFSLWGSPWGFPQKSCGNGNSLPKATLVDFPGQTIQDFNEGEHITNFISSETMRHNYATFQKSTTFDILILNFKIKMDG